MLFEGQSQYLQFQPRICAQRRPPRNSIGRQWQIDQRITTFVSLPRRFLLSSGTATHCVNDRSYLRLMLKYKFEPTLLSPPSLLCCLLDRTQWGPGIIKSGRTVVMLCPVFRHHVSR